MAAKQLLLKKFAGLLRRKSATKENTAASSRDEQALLRRIAKESEKDPLIGAKIGSKAITQRLIRAMKSEKGIHIESLLCALGSIAGYSCQAALRAQAIAKRLPETAFLTVAETQDGKVYFFGDHLNKLLAESPYSVWGISGGGAQEIGCANLPDILEIFKHTSAMLGTPEFGVPRVLEKNKPYDTPTNYVRIIWPELKPLIVKFCPNPEHWPVLLSLSIQEVMLMGQSAVDPYLALRIVMESAIPMSKIELHSR